MRRLASSLYSTLRSACAAFKHPHSRGEATSASPSSPLQYHIDKLGVHLTLPSHPSMGPTVSTFTHEQLRENCRCPQCYIKTADQRRPLRFSDVSVTSLNHSKEHSGWLDVHFSDGHIGQVPFLHPLSPSAHTHKQPLPTSATSWDPRAGLHITKAPWSGPIDALQWHDYPSLMAARDSDTAAYDMGLFAVYCELERHGLAKLRAAGTAKGVVASLSTDLSGYVIQSPWGSIFDIQNTRKGNNVAYGSSDAIKPHTDTCYFETPPGLIMLHCVTPAERGGHSVFSDGLFAAEKLRREHPDAFELLCRVPVPYRVCIDDWDCLAEHPVFRLNEQGDVTQVCFADFSRFSLGWRRPASELSAMYEALGLFREIVNDPANQVVMPLQEGEVVIMDNYRVLHARTDFSGHRYLEGCYIDWMGTRAQARRRGWNCLKSDRFGAATRGMLTG
ncbi:unnamed protein product [Vitrella brassicaformis CCMP3155]|uniref:trimethyllysine dioxygenase n=1 Tax=Vitrella brassicaformis (strain CCMP3155) TaxID=1169540 RepID=A0A0G4F2I8_VITBC|nr:unnamed protein product [Vitrella brassicaformis CCMP3155]|eukprot:CEM06412.1 unnamed protein product [Vitrella brassicaformis CCMP3155]